MKYTTQAVNVLTVLNRPRSTSVWTRSTRVYNIYNNNNNNNNNIIYSLLGKQQINEQQYGKIDTN